MKKLICSVLAITMMLSISFATFAPFSGAMPLAPIIFSDVPQDAVYHAALASLANICELGYGDGTFRPEAAITRAEFAALLVKILEKTDMDTVKLDQIFADVSVSHWGNKYITIAFDKGIVNGYGGGEFKPDGNIKYEEMIKIVVCYILGGDMYDISYPDGYIEIAETLEIADIQSGKGQDAKRWQVAMLIYNATNVDDARIKEIAETLPVIRSGGVTGGSASSGGGSGASKSPTASTDVVFADAMESAPMAPMPAPSEIAEMPAATGTPAPIGTPAPGFEGEFIAPMDRNIRAGLLTAGEWNDNNNWDFWNKVMANREWYTLQSKWKISTNRYVVNVTDGAAPVMGAKVALWQGETLVWAAITDNKGRAVIFADMAGDAADNQGNEFSLQVKSGTESKFIDSVMLTDDKPYEVSIAQGDLGSGIDVMFMIDTTGSMGDELQYIKEELSDVIGRIDGDVRISCNFYRDLSDEYIVRPFAFTSDVDEAVTQISKQRAAGGGDYPEAVELALSNAIYEHEWNPYAKERFLFLVLDAPPHYTPEIVEKINECVKSAAEQGIRIIPIASSGVDKDTEFLLRSMSIATNGTYVFLTDHSGIGNSHIEPTIGAYDVEYLNDLIVKIINNRL